ncbi:MAG: urease accessory protein UreF [Cyanobacteria bacterium REEB459]|nr:urease accessory protein UreF [Cyanobacteria bacterium REEB459]
MVPDSQPSEQALLRLLQLASPSLPVGAYSYSEGLETLVSQGLTDPAEIRQWLEQELAWGLIRLEVTLLYRLYGASPEELNTWNQWLSARRDTAEGRHQSWAMGRALGRLLAQLHPEQQAILAQIALPWNYVVIFAVISKQWQISPSAAGLAYLHSWAANLITAAVKLVPLGQTQGQQMLLDLYPSLETTAQQGQQLDPEQLSLSNWGTSLATMEHEAMYSRLFRS